jgi:predicted  nucleic acid-binding Zn-ribbon protein
LASPAYELILEIQAIDLSIDRLRHRARTHPGRDRLAGIDERLADHDREANEIEERHHGAERQVKRLEDEVATIEARRRDVEGKLYGGEVTASKELLALQDEAAGLLDRQTGLEDEELELMEQLEGLAGELRTSAGARATMEAERADAEAELERGLAEIDAEVADLIAQRSERERPEPGSVQGWDELLARYENLRPQYDGVPVARLADGRCDGCHIQLSAVAVDRMAKMPEDAVVTCEECGRLLVR